MEIRMAEFLSFDFLYLISNFNIMIRKIYL